MFSFTMNDHREKQFTEIYSKYEKYIFHILLKFTNNNDLAEDLKQESFLQIFKSFDTFDPEKGTFLAWASTIAKNIFYRYINSKKYQANENSISDEYFFSQVDTKQNIESSIEEKILSEEIKNLISCLEEPTRSIFIYKYKENLSLEEIGLRLQISKRTVSRKYLAALKHIKEEILKKNLQL